MNGPGTSPRPRLEEVAARIEELAGEVDRLARTVHASEQRLAVIEAGQAPPVTD